MRKLDKEERCAGGPRALKTEAAVEGRRVDTISGLATRQFEAKQSRMHLFHLRCCLLKKTFFPPWHGSVGFSPHLSSCQSPELSDQESGDQSGAQRRGMEALGQESSVRMQNPAQGVSQDPGRTADFLLCGVHAGLIRQSSKHLAFIKRCMWQIIYLKLTNESE